MKRVSILTAIGILCSLQAHWALAAPAGKPGKPAVTRQQRKLFTSIARSVVGAYEALGSVAARYDAEGRCRKVGGKVEEQDLCTIWRFSSNNPTLRVVLDRFRPATSKRRIRGPDAALVGSYLGHVTFRKSGEPVRIAIELRFTRSDLLVRLRVTKGRRLASL